MNKMKKLFLIALLSALPVTGVLGAGEKRDVTVTLDSTVPEGIPGGFSLLIVQSRTEPIAGIVTAETVSARAASKHIFHIEPGDKLTALCRTHNLPGSVETLNSTLKLDESHDNYLLTISKYKGATGTKNGEHKPICTLKWTAE
jgi:hypothetical protein